MSGGCNWAANDFEIGLMLGEGKYGPIYLAREKGHQVMVALKALNKVELKKDKVEQIIGREIERHRSIKHPNILNMFGYFTDDKNIYLILEYAYNGDLYKILKRKGRFEERQTAEYIRQITEGLKVCHINEIIHRDIKPENIFVAIDGTMKISDFGWHMHLPHLNTRRTRLGAEWDYWSPELIECKNHNQNIDLWSLGVLCYELLVGQPPFRAQTYSAIHKNIRNVIFEFPHYVSEGARDLIIRLLQMDPKMRLSLDDVLQHPWIVKNVY